MKGVITSDGNIIDLDPDNGVQNLPPESLSMERRSYGGYPLSLKKGFGHFYDTSHGYDQFYMERQEMKKLPFYNTVHQNLIDGDIFYMLKIPYNGMMHAIQLTYDYDHPDFEMKARILYPFIDRTKTGHHLYKNGDVCYIENWNRKFRAIHVAMQVCFWIKDYWNNNLDETRYNDMDPFDMSGFLRRFMH